MKKKAPASKSFKTLKKAAKEINGSGNSVQPVSYPHDYLFPRPTTPNIALIFRR